MFDTTVTINGQSVVIDLADEMISDEDTLIEKAKDLLDYEDQFDEEGDEIDAEVILGRPDECGLEEAFDYVDWLVGSKDRDSEGIVEAAVFLDIPASDIDDCYQGQYDSVKDFVKQEMESLDLSIPDWIDVDYQGTWDSSLRFDYVEENGHYFLNI